MLCPIVLWFGHGKYQTSPPTGSVLATSLRLWRLAAKGRWSLNPRKCYRQLTADDFWENVKPSKFSDETRPKWMTFDDKWVDEVRRGLAACSVFCYFPVYCKSHTCLFPSQKLFIWNLRAFLQPVDEQLDFSGCCYVRSRRPQRCFEQSRPFRFDYLHPHL